MSAETVAYSTLSGAGAVTAITGTRIYPDFAPTETALPAIAFSRVNTVYTNVIHQAAPVGVDVVLEVWCMAETRKVAEQLGDAVVAALGAATPSGFYMQDRTPDFDAESKIFAAVLTVRFHEL
jgi:hypothetical protein